MITSWLICTSFVGISSDTELVGDVQTGLYGNTGTLSETVGAPSTLSLMATIDQPDLRSHLVLQTIAWQGKYRYSHQDTYPVQVPYVPVPDQNRTISEPLGAIRLHRAIWYTEPIPEWTVKGGLMAAPDFGLGLERRLNFRYPGFHRSLVLPAVEPERTPSIPGVVATYDLHDGISLFGGLTLGMIEYHLFSRNGMFIGTKGAFQDGGTHIDFSGWIGGVDAHASRTHQIAPNAGADLQLWVGFFGLSVIGGWAQRHIVTDLFSDYHYHISSTLSARFQSKTMGDIEVGVGGSLLKANTVYGNAPEFEGVADVSVQASPLPNLDIGVVASSVDPHLMPIVFTFGISASYTQKWNFESK